jgi:hypothetical protein
MNERSHGALWAVFACASLFFLSSPSLADTMKIVLDGYQEVPPVSTRGIAEFRLRGVDYELDYDLEGTIQQAHIHFAPEKVNGGIVIWLCVNPRFSDLKDEAPEGTPACRGSSGLVEGTIKSRDVVGPEVQGIEPGDIGKVAEAALAGQLYINVHSDLFAGGEVRGQMTLFKDDGHEALDDLEERISALEEDVEDLLDDFDDHRHEYRTGRGNGHNNVEATTGPAEF